MSLKKLIIWDFDGVLFDSLNECLIITKLSYEILQKNITTLTKNHVYNISNEAKKDESIKKMKDLRPFIIKGQDYLWQFSYLNKFNKKISNLKDYKVVFNEIYNIKEDKIFEEAFYSTRSSVQELLSDDYFLLFRPYTGSLSSLKKSLITNNNYICSARDFKAIQTILSFNNIYFDPNKIFTKDYNGFGENHFSKCEQIMQILEKENHYDSEFTLIEDQIKVPLFLIERFPKIKVLYAKYGYGSHREWSRIDHPNLITLDKAENLYQKLSN